jgi:hypothetical protein
MAMKHSHMGVATSPAIVSAYGRLTIAKEASEKAYQLSRTLLAKPKVA